MSRDEASMQILRKVVIDGLLMCGLVLCIMASREFLEPFQRGFFCLDESLMFPYKGDTVTTPTLRLVGLLLPSVAFLICEWALLRKEHDDQRCLGVRIPAWLRGFYCTIASFGLGYCFVELATDIAKITIGRPRPHFFDVCQPSIDCQSAEWQNRYIQSHEYTCTGPMAHKFREMRLSFLSGHSAVAAYTMVYFALYLEKRMVWKTTRILRHILQFVALMLSWFTALSRVSDFKHHWSDVLAGYSLGLSIAIVVVSFFLIFNAIQYLFYLHVLFA
ncbi:unnamed protein product [Diatraea saccharalis]|uniref:Phosphatidic acid phosphatase type 2/haloperoxidase domain-containing protein n=1 Tax=Diatraea saccharalis TaxID=40085 RepID=A0A9P0G136_9NEOP|nr:unnamed protein product [Diatraea saccharalis]